MAITNKPQWKLALGLPLLIFLACFFITLSAKFSLNQALLSNAIIMDLLITAPLVYFLVIRKTTVSKLTITRVFIAGLLFAGWILNDHANTLLQTTKIWISPLIEGIVLFFIAQKFYAANKKAKYSGENNIDFLLHCRAVLQQVIGNEKAGNIVASEISVFYYVIIGRRDKNIDYSSKFTSYKENGIVLILGTFLSLFLIETIGVHLLLSLWNTAIAWIFTGFSFYTCLQLYAHIKAIKARPITLNAGSLEIHNGLAGDASIRYNNIEKVELSNKIPIDRNAIKIALIKGLENHNCVIYLKRPIEATRIFGIKKKTDTILFFVDKPKEFLTAIDLKLINGIN